MHYLELVIMHLRDVLAVLSNTSYKILERHRDVNVSVGSILSLLASSKHFCLDSHHTSAHVCIIDLCA